MSAADCLICQRIASPGDLAAKVVYEDHLWVARHSRETDILGYLLLESKRHILDLSEATERECSSLGRLVGALTGAIKRTTSAERVYSFSLGEAVPHFHLHLIPRTAATPRGFRGRGILSYPLTPQASPPLLAETCSRISRELKRSVSLKAGAQLSS